MTSLERILLIVGCITFASAALGVAIKRHRFANFEDTPPSLSTKNQSTKLPSDVSAGMIGAWLNTSVDFGDVLIGLVELASLGYIQLHPLARLDDEATKTGLRPTDEWLIRLLNRDISALPEYQQTLLTAPFGGGRKTGTKARTNITLSDLAIDSRSAMMSARTQLRHATSARGWSPAEGAAEFRNAWGLAGGAGLFLGLAGTVVMIFGGLATSSILGIIGTMLIAISGAMIASLGPIQTKQTPSELNLSDDALSHYEFLRTLDASKISLDSAANDFSSWLPAAIAFNLTHHLGEVFDVVVDQAAQQETPLDATLTWLVTTDIANEQPLRPSQLVAVVAEFVNKGAHLAHYDSNSLIYKIHSGR